jgi:hypothetical protein
VAARTAGSVWGRDGWAHRASYRHVDERPRRPPRFDQPRWQRRSRTELLHASLERVERLSHVPTRLADRHRRNPKLGDDPYDDVRTVGTVGTVGTGSPVGRAGRFELHAEHREFALELAVLPFQLDAPFAQDGGQVAVVRHELTNHVDPYSEITQRQDAAELRKLRGRVHPVPRRRVHPRRPEHAAGVVVAQHLRRDASDGGERSHAKHGHSVVVDLDLG